MTNLLDQYNRIKSFPNGEAVAKKLAQLYDCSLDPQYDYLPVGRVANALAEHGEGKILDRTDSEIRRDGEMLKPYLMALTQASAEEWGDFKEELQVSPLPVKEGRILLQLEAGHIKPDELKSWVLGELEVQSSPEIK